MKAPRINAKAVPTYAVFAVLLVAAVVTCVSFGSTDIPFRDVLRVIAGKSLGLGSGAAVERSHELIVWNVRLPRVLLAATVGGGLSIVGAAMQATFRNPLAEPGILGWSSGGALFAVLAIYAGVHQQWFFVLPVAAFAGTLATAWAVYRISSLGGFVENTALLLSGVAVGTLFVSLTTFVLSVSNAWSMKEMLFWIMGGVDSRTWAHFAAAFFPVSAASAAVAFHARDLNAMLLGPETAKTVGVDVERSTRRLMVLSSLIVGAGVAVSGIVGFVGLVVPHVARLVVGVDHRRLLPASFVAGAVFLPTADLLARTAMAPREIRLGVITSFVGVPFFLFLLRKSFGGRKGA